MTGTALLGLILLSMSWLYFFAGLALNLYAWTKKSPAPLVILPGVAGSLAVFFSLPALMRLGIDLPWPWLWVLLPLASDPYNPPLSWLITPRPPKK